MTKDSQDIRDRCFRFACSAGRFALALGATPGARPVADQLLKSSTSVGANLEEAKAASSRREFLRYIEIALRESREAAYWLRICEGLQLNTHHEIEPVRHEAEQIARIIGAIAVRTRAAGR